jgi:ribose-phosphate pyrophosphokinase
MSNVIAVTWLIPMQLAKAAETVNQHGASEVYAIVTHGILSGKAIDTINNSCLSGLVVTNSK